MNQDSPWTVLGLEPGAGEDVVRVRYTELVKKHPPDKDPDAFQRIRDAFARIRDPRVSVRERLFGPPPLADLNELTEAFVPFPRRPAGLDAWIDALRELSR
jgi:hypothetical protein